MKGLRILWLFRHRTARYEEVNAMLRTGAEVIPIGGVFEAFPNAVEFPEEDDPYYPDWRSTCTIPDDALELIRTHDYYATPAKIAPDVREKLDRWIHVVWIGTFTPVALSLVRSFRGAVVLRPYGGFQYTGSLGHGRRRTQALNYLASSERYAFCPAIPYQALVEDPRLTRNEVFWPACVTLARLGHQWRGAESDPIACEVISLIERYRTQVFQKFDADFGELPLRIFGQNPTGGPERKDQRIVGTLPDDAYYGGMAACRVMIYRGTESKYHLHYHALEAMMMGVPVIFFSSSGLAHTALFMGASVASLRSAGMCESASEARTLATRLLLDPAEAIALSERQEPVRALYRPESWDDTLAALLAHLGRNMSYRRSWADPASDRKPTSKRLSKATKLPSAGRHRAGALLKKIRSSIAGATSR